MKPFGMPGMRKPKPPTEEEYFKDLKRKVQIFSAIAVTIFVAPYILNQIQKQMNSSPKYVSFSGNFTFDLFAIYRSNSKTKTAL